MSNPLLTPGTRIVIDGAERTIREARVITPANDRVTTSYGSRYGSSRTTTYPAEVFYAYEGPFTTPGSVKEPRQTRGNSGAHIERALKNGMAQIVSNTMEGAA